MKVFTFEKICNNEIPILVRKEFLMIYHYLFFYLDNNDKDNENLNSKKRKANTDIDSKPFKNLSSTTHKTNFFYIGIIR